MLGCNGNVEDVIQDFFSSLYSSLCEFWLSVDLIFEKIAMFLNFAILENESSTDNKMKHGRFGRIFVTFYPKSKGRYI